jgi:hypothetical protein
MVAPMPRTLAFVVMVLAAYGCRREQKAPAVLKERADITQAADVVDPQTLYIGNTS